MNSPPIEAEDYYAFRKRVLAIAAREKCPVDASFAITHRCNLKCVHCYIPDHNNSDELTLDELQGILDQIVDAGALLLWITGGEPLIREDFPEIYVYARKKGLIITLFTNGTLISDDIVDLLKRWPPRIVEISLYGGSEATYE